MKNKIITTSIQYAGKKMDGKKTTGGAIGKMLAGVAGMMIAVVGILGTMFPDQGLPAMDYDTASMTFLAGFYGFFSGLEGIGIAHKFVKAMAAKSTPVQ